MTEAALSSSPARPAGQLLGVLLIVISACSFGSGPLLVQGPYDAGMQPLTIVFWRFFVGVSLMWVIVLASGAQRRALRSLSPRRVALLALLGVIYVGNSGTFTAALQTVPISLNTIITYIYPGLVAVLSMRFLRRLHGRRAWAGLLLSTLGVVVAVGGVPEGQLPPAWGLALAIVSPVIYAVWIVLQARLTGDRPAGEAPPAGATPGRADVAGLGVDATTPATRWPDGAGPGEPPVPDVLPSDAEALTVRTPDAPRATAVMTSATCLTFAALLLVTGGSLSPADVPSAAWPGLLGFGAIATALAISTFYAGVSRIGGARAALVSTVEPIYTITLATLLFGEALTPTQLLGGGLVIGGVLLAESAQRAGRPAPDGLADPG